VSERWLVRLLVTRDPETEGHPTEWKWDEMVGGEPVVLHTERVGEWVVGHEGYTTQDADGIWWEWINGRMTRVEGQSRA
jgi:hypothetical protein